jgi:hypothetical protein
MTLMLEIAGGIMLAVVGGFIFLFVVSIVVGALRPKPKYVPLIKFPKELPMNPGNIDRPLK